MPFLKRCSTWYHKSILKKLFWCFYWEINKVIWWTKTSDLSFLNHWQAIWSIQLSFVKEEKWRRYGVWQSWMGYLVLPWEVVESRFVLPHHGSFFERNIMVFNGAIRSRLSVTTLRRADQWSLGSSIESRLEKGKEAGWKQSFSNLNLERQRVEY